MGIQQYKTTSREIKVFKLNTKEEITDREILRRLSLDLDSGRLDIHYNGTGSGYIYDGDYERMYDVEIYHEGTDFNYEFE